LRLRVLGLVLLPAVLVRHMMPDDTAAHGAQDAVMGEVAGDSPDERTFQAAFGFGRDGRQNRGQRQSERGGHCECGFHDNSFPDEPRSAPTICRTTRTLTLNAAI
jgi:hypothetical protein